MNTNRLSSLSLIIAILLLSALFTGLATAPAAAQTNSSVQASNMKRIIFRDDDIAPFGQLDTLKAVDQVHIDKNVPATIGIIAHPDRSFSGNELLADTNTLYYLQSLASNPLFELAQHGFTHYDDTLSIVGGSPPRMVGASPYQERLVGAAYSEFSGRAIIDQYNIIKQGRDDITKALGVTPTTFIPPWNSGDSNTLTACTALGFTLYSTGWDDFNAGVDRQFPYESSLVPTSAGIMMQAASFSLGWDSDAGWQTGMPSLIAQTDASLNGAPGGASFVVLYHYWQFNKADGSPDPARIALFAQYIDHLKSRGDVQFTTLCNQNELGNSAAVFAQGTDGALWYKRRSSGQYWWAWKSLGGVLSSAPAAVSRPNGKIDVFVRGSDGALWSRATTNEGTTWSNWYLIGGQLHDGTGPAAYAWGDTRIGWVVTGTDNKLWHMWKDGAGTHGWQSLGGVLTSSPGATSSTSGAIDVFVRGSDNAVWQRGYTTNGWSGWKSLGGQLAPNMGPAVSSWSAGRLDVFVVGTDSRLWHKSYQNVWSIWDSLGGACASSPAATSGASGRIDVFVRGTDGALWHK
ncbi:MAG: DUF2334 domain-containing protein [Halobacteriota archaeon]